MKINTKQILKFIAVPLIVGGVSAFFTRKVMNMFDVWKQPPLSPPAWLFPIVWTILYILMGIASYLVYYSDKEENEKQNKQLALKIYSIQLLVNFLWPVFFFNFQWLLFSFIWLLLLWILVYFMLFMFGKFSKPAMYMIIPYLIWTTFAGYLNFGIWWLN